MKDPTTPKAGRVARFLAFDLGAESSRVMVGLLDGDSLQVRELHRFPTRNATIRNRSFWDVLFVFGEMQQGLRLYQREYGPALMGMGIDSWAVDFGLLTPGGQMLTNPVQYRDHRTDGILEEAFEVLPREVIYARTGIQFLPFNTLYQLWAMQRTAPRVLAAAHTFLMIPDLLNFFLTGRACCEYTNASTTQLLNVHRRTWSHSVMQAFALPIGIMPEIVMPGTNLGRLDERLQADAGLEPVAVIAPCTHDTGSAIAAVPSEGRHWAYISCGTWSVLGVELEEPVVGEKALAYNFTNEGGYNGRIRLLKNIMGLWVLQQCRARWAARGQEYSYTALVELAAAAPPLETVLNIDDPSYLNPADMLDTIAAQCRQTKQTVPEGVGGIVRAVLEGIALRYACVLQELEEIMEDTVERVHMVGGGINNELLCQWASDAMARPVIAGPVEATAIGNIAVQAIATGLLPDLAAARRLIARSSNLKTYTPQASARWQKMLARYQALYR
ncbi:MAG: rhamnulokinase [Opitutaceae bacterium]|nr:rhamnulokinase [Opitutaceae bacterium]